MVSRKKVNIGSLCPSLADTATAKFAQWIWPVYFRGGLCHANRNFRQNNITGVFPPTAYANACCSMFLLVQRPCWFTSPYEDNSVVKCCPGCGQLLKQSIQKIKLSQDFMKPEFLFYCVNSTTRKSYLVVYAKETRIIAQRSCSRREHLTSEASIESPSACDSKCYSWRLNRRIFSEKSSPSLEMYMLPAYIKRDAFGLVKYICC